jgi:hypothetical protein
VNDLVHVERVEARSLLEYELEFVDAVQRLVASHGGVDAVAVNDGDSDKIATLDDLCGDQYDGLKGQLCARPSLHRACGIG